MVSKYQKAIEERRAASENVSRDDTPLSVSRDDTSRPAARDKDPRSRAAARAAELRQHLGDLDEGTDEFYVPASLVPDGWAYEWKRHKVWNEEDPAYITHLAREGWEAVPLDRDKDHMAMMPKGWSSNIIERKGMVLMERPTEISEEIRSIELRRAREQVRVKEAQLAGTPEGTLSRNDPRVAPKIKKSFDMPIPEDL